MLSSRFPIFRRRRPPRPAQVEILPPETGDDRASVEEPRIKTIALWITLMARP
jgi:hypothetical protein